MSQSKCTCRPEGAAFMACGPASIPTFQPIFQPMDQFQQLEQLIQQLSTGSVKQQKKLWKMLRPITDELDQKFDPLSRESMHNHQTRLTHNPDIRPNIPNPKNVTTPWNNSADVLNLESVGSVKDLENKLKEKQAEHHIKKDRPPTPDFSLDGFGPKNHSPFPATVGSFHKHPNHDIRSAPKTPKVPISPWMNSTIEPDTSIKSLV